MHQIYWTANIFADDTNLFLSHQNVNTLFKISNEELKNFRNWFKANKLSLNNRKSHKR